MAKCGNRAKGRAYRDRHNGVATAQPDDEITEAAS
jgi:hypothetical protein